MMPPRYAKNTDVTVDRSRTEIERTLQRYGAVSFVCGWQPGEAVVMFQIMGRHIRFLLPLPDRQAEEFVYVVTNQHGSRRKRSEEVGNNLWEQACRARWRALLLIIKAKLEAIESGITTLEVEFLPYTVLPSGKTVTEWLEPQVEQAYNTGQMPAALPGFTAPALMSGE